MKPIKKTAHVMKRQNQRSIPDALLSILLFNGTEVQAPDGIKFLLSNKTKQQIRRELKEVLSNFDSLSNAYMISDTDCKKIITAGYIKN